MGNSCSNNCNPEISVKNTIIQNDIIIDDFIKKFYITKLNIEDVDKAIRSIITSLTQTNKSFSKKESNKQIEQFFSIITNQNNYSDKRFFNESINYEKIYYNLLLNITNANYQYFKHLGLLLIPLSFSSNHIIKAHFISSYIIDYFGLSVNDLYDCLRHIVEINTDYLYQAFNSYLADNQNKNYFKIFSISRKEKYIQEYIKIFCGIYNDFLSQLGKIEKVDELIYYVNKDFKTKDESLIKKALNMAFNSFFERNIQCIDGKFIRESILEDYFKENKL